MKEIIEIIEKLRELSGNEQLNYLKSHKDNEMLREVLYYTYNPDMKYNINEAKLDKALGSVLITSDMWSGVFGTIGKDVWEGYKNVLKTMSSKKGIKEADIILLCREYFFKYDEKSTSLLKQILLKDLRINMGIKSFNKVWSDFYSRWYYMGCKPFSMKNLEKITYPAIAQTKMDGLFCNALVVDGVVSYVSRQGKPITIQGSLDGILLDIYEKYNRTDFVLNGEILVLNEDKTKVLDRATSNGIIRRDNKTQDELDRIILKVWDIVNYDNFIEGKWNKPYNERLVILQDLLKDSKNRINIVDTYVVKNIDDAMKLFNQKYAEGEEGIVVKNLNTIWVDGKPSDQVKVKSEKDCDLKIISFEEGSGAYEGMCGAINCVSADNLLFVSVKPRTPAIAQEVWNNQEKYIDKIIAVKYNEKIKRKDKDTWSLFLPVYIEIRDDKEMADKLEEIK